MSNPGHNVEWSAIDLLKLIDGKNIIRIISLGACVRKYMYVCAWVPECVCMRVCAHCLCGISKMLYIFVR